MVTQNVKHIVWSALENFSGQGIQFIVSIVLARLLMPSDYGLIGILNIFIIFGQVFIDSGFSLAIIQKIDRNEIDYATTFYFNICVSLILYFIFFFLAIYIAKFYQQDMLRPLSRVLCLTLIVNSFSLIQKVKLIVEKRFKTLASISVSTGIISGFVGISFALLGMGVWSLVAQSLSYALGYSIALWWVVKWKPLKVFSIVSFKRLYSFGIKIFLSGLLHVLYTNIYPLLIGKFFTVSYVGYFTRAQTLSNYPSMTLTAIVDRTAYPLWCSMQDNSEELKRSFYSFLRTTTFFVFPIMVGMSILAKSLVILLLSEKWLFSANLISILCFSYIFFPIMDFNWQLLNSKGRSDLSLKTELINKVIAMVSLIILSYYFGINGLCWSLVIYSISAIIISSHYINKIIDISLVSEIKEIIPIIVNTTFMGLVLFLFNTVLNVSPVLQIIYNILIGTSVYFGIAVLFKFKEIKYIYYLIKSRKIK